HRRRAIENLRGILDLLLQLNPGGGKSLAVCGNARSEATSPRQRCRGRTRGGEAAGLVDAGQFLRETLRPATRNRRVIVDEDIGTVVDRRAIEEGFDENECLPVLI